MTFAPEMNLAEAQQRICEAIIEDDFLTAVVGCFRRLSGADMAFIALFEPGNPLLQIVAASGDSNRLADASVLISREGEGKPILQGKSVEGKILEKKRYAIHAESLFEEDYSYLTLPIYTKDKVIGVVEVLKENGEAFSGKDKHKLEQLGSFTGIAFENNSIFNQIYTYAITKEKDKLSKKMHDHLCQQLAYLKIQAGVLETNIRENKTEEADACLKDIRSVLNSAYSGVRDMIDSLRSPSGSRKSEKKADGNPAVFYKTIRDMLERYHESTGISTELMISREAGVLYTPEAAEQITLIIQEALSNVLKHAEAKGVLVCFKTSGEDTIMLTIEDDGKGFNRSDLNDYDGHQHYGLKIMEERAESIHAKFTCESKPGEGTRISIFLPSGGF